MALSAIVEPIFAAVVRLFDPTTPNPFSKDEAEAIVTPFASSINWTDIFLFDSKGYEKSMSFDHSLIEKIKINKPLMIAGNIKLDDDLENYKKIADIIDISGGLETSGIKDKSKIDIFLNKVEQIKNET